MGYLLIALLLFIGCYEESPTGPIHGCFDSQACNYNPSASIDNNNLDKAKDYFDGFSRAAKPENKSDYAKLIFFIIENKNRVNVVNFFEEYFKDNKNQELHVNFI